MKQLSFRQKPAQNTVAWTQLLVLSMTVISAGPGPGPAERWFLSHYASKCYVAHELNWHYRGSCHRTKMFSTHIQLPQHNLLWKLHPLPRVFIVVEAEAMKQISVKTARCLWEITRVYLDQKAHRQWGDRGEGGADGTQSHPVCHLTLGWRVMEPSQKSAQPLWARAGLLWGGLGPNFWNESWAEKEVIS